jgi:hypothetical protein
MPLHTIMLAQFVIVLLGDSKVVSKFMGEDKRTCCLGQGENVKDVEQICHDLHRIFKIRQCIKS